MAAGETPSWRAQVDTAAVDLRNEAIAQSANLVLLGRRATLVGVGSVFLGIDQVQKLLHQAVARGERVEYDTHQAVGRLRSQATDDVEAAKHAAGSRLSASVSTGVAALLNLLPGVHVQYAAPHTQDAAVSAGETSDAQTARKL